MKYALVVLLAVATLSCASSRPKTAATSPENSKAKMAPPMTTAGVLAPGFDSEAGH